MNNATKIREELLKQERQYRECILEVRAGLVHPQILVTVISELTVLFPLWIMLGHGHAGGKLCGLTMDTIEHCTGWKYVDHIRRSVLALKIEFDRHR